MENTLMKDEHSHDDQSAQSSCQGCGCCGPVEYEFKDEDLTPELLKLKASMSSEEFEEFMKALI